MKLVIKGQDVEVNLAALGELIGQPVLKGGKIAGRVVGTKVQKDELIAVIELNDGSKIRHKLI